VLKTSKHSEKVQIVGYININKDYLHGQKWNTFQYVLKFVLQNWFNGFGFMSPLYLTLGLEL